MNARVSHRPVSLGQEPEFERYVSSVAGVFADGRDRVPSYTPSSSAGKGWLMVAVIGLLGLVGAP